jgi:predicted small secreted protein
MNRIAILTAALFLSVTLTACNTVEGAGQDIQKGGQSIERAADSNK